MRNWGSYLIGGTHLFGATHVMEDLNNRGQPGAWKSACAGGAHTQISRLTVLMTHPISSPLTFKEEPERVWRGEGSRFWASVPPLAPPSLPTLLWARPSSQKAGGKQERHRVRHWSRGSQLAHRLSVCPQSHGESQSDPEGQVGRAGRTL